MQVFIGPIPIEFCVGVDGGFGLRIVFAICFEAQRVSGAIIPFVWAEVYFSVGVNLGFVKGAFELRARVLEIDFVPLIVLDFKDRQDVSMKRNNRFIYYPFRVRMYCFACFAVAKCSL